MSPTHSYTKEFELEVISLIERFPGLGLRELSRELRISPQALKYNTDKLLKEGSILTKRDGKFSRFYVKGFQIEEFEEKILSCIRKPQLLNVLLIFLQTQKDSGIDIIKNQELTNKLNLQSAGTVTYYINQLIDNDIIEKSKSGFRLKNPFLIESLIKKYYPSQSVIDNFINLWTQYFR